MICATCLEEIGETEDGTLLLHIDNETFDHIARPAKEN